MNTNLLCAPTLSSFKFQVSSFKFQVSSFKFQVSSFKFQVWIALAWVLKESIVHLRWRRLFTFSPLRRVTFCQTRQKVTKKRCAPFIRPLRCASGFPHSGLAPGRTALQAPSWGPALDRHPCLSPPSASPAFGLLKSRRSKARSKATATATATVSIVGVITSKLAAIYIPCRSGFVPRWAAQRPQS